MKDEAVNQKTETSYKLNYDFDKVNIQSSQMLRSDRSDHRELRKYAT